MGTFKGHGNDADFPKFLNKSVRHMVPYTTFRAVPNLASNSESAIECVKLSFNGESESLRLPASLSREVAMVSRGVAFRNIFLNYHLFTEL